MQALRRTACAWMQKPLQTSSSAVSRPGTIQTSQLSTLAQGVPTLASLAG